MGAIPSLGKRPASAKDTAHLVPVPHCCHQNTNHSDTLTKSNYSTFIQKTFINFNLPYIPPQLSGSSPLSIFLILYWTYSALANRCADTNTLLCQDTHLWKQSSKNPQNSYLSSQLTAFPLNPFRIVARKHLPGKAS